MMACDTDSLKVSHLKVSSYLCSFDSNNGSPQLPQHGSNMFEPSFWRVPLLIFVANSDVAASSSSSSSRHWTSVLAESWPTVSKWLGNPSVVRTTAAWCKALKTRFPWNYHNRSLNSRQQHPTQRHDFFAHQMDTWCVSKVNILCADTLVKPIEYPPPSMTSWKINTRSTMHSGSLLAVCIQKRCDIEI